MDRLLRESRNSSTRFAARGVNPASLHFTFGLPGFAYSQMAIVGSVAVVEAKNDAHSLGNYPRIKPSRLQHLDRISQDQYDVGAVGGFVAVQMS